MTKFNSKSIQGWMGGGGAVKHEATKSLPNVFDLKYFNTKDKIFEKKQKTPIYIMEKLQSFFHINPTLN